MDTTSKKNKNTQRRLKESVVSVLILVTLAVTGYYTIHYWIESHRTDIPSAPVVAGDENNKFHTDGQPDQTPLAENALDSYSVAADAPRAIYIKKIGVAARVMPMGTNKDGSMQAPYSAFDAGWFTGSAKPGSPGAALLDGHSSGASQIGAFGRLNMLSEGDVITIEMGDKTSYEYRVVAKETVARENVDMKKASVPYNNAEEGANFITCAGRWTKDGKTLTDRVVVYSVRI